MGEGGGDYIHHEYAREDEIYVLDPRYGVYLPADDMAKDKDVKESRDPWCDEGLGGYSEHPVNLTADEGIESYPVHHPSPSVILR